VDDEDDIMGHGNGSSNSNDFDTKSIQQGTDSLLVVVYHWRELGVLPWSMVRGAE
jgi:hypothetical protein